MRLHEFEAKQLLAAAGIPVPEGEPASDGDTAGAIATRLGGAVVVKAQVLAGGRGRDGGVEIAADPAQAATSADAMLCRPCRGIVPQQVLIERALPIATELYAGLTIDPALGRPVLLLGQGGVDVEDRARAGGAPLRRSVDPLTGVTPELAASLVADARAEPARPLADLLVRLWQVFSEQQALTVEINPVAVLAGGELCAADAVIELDDSARELAGLPRRAEEGPFRRERDGGMTFVEFGGDVGLICSGAGLAMASMDLIARRARPANFLETGGGISRDLMKRAMERVLACDGIRGVFINVYGGINPIHEGALGIADVMPRGVTVPVVAKALGNHQEETWEILEAAGVTVVRDVSTEAAVDALLDRMETEVAV